MVASGLLAAALLMSGCSTLSGQRVVFREPVEHPFGPLHTQETLDMVAQFWNLTSEPVHLVRISLAAPNPAVKLIGTSVYNAARTGGFPAERIGDLPKECPKRYSPSPVTSLTVAPHQYSHWFAAVAIKITKPGHYLIRRLRIDYTTPSGPGWQYFDIHFTLTVSNPPLPGPFKRPANGSCGG